MENLTSTKICFWEFAHSTYRIALTRVLWQISIGGWAGCVPESKSDTMWWNMCRAADTRRMWSTDFDRGTVSPFKIASLTSAIKVSLMVFRVSVASASNRYVVFSASAPTMATNTSAIEVTGPWRDSSLASTVSLAVGLRHSRATTIILSRRPLPRLKYAMRRAAGPGCVEPRMLNGVCSFISRIFWVAKRNVHFSPLKSRQSSCVSPLPVSASHSRSFSSMSLISLEIMKPWFSSERNFVMAAVVQIAHHWRVTVEFSSNGIQVFCTTCTYHLNGRASHEQTMGMYNAFILQVLLDIPKNKAFTLLSPGPKKLLFSSVRG